MRKKITAAVAFAIAAFVFVPTIVFGTGLFYMDSNGNAAFGNTDPKARVDVSGSIYSRLVTDTDSSSTTIDWNEGNVHSLSLALEETTLHFLNGQAGGEYKLILSGDREVVWPDSVKWANGEVPVLNGTSILSFLFDGSSYLGSVSSNYSSGKTVSVLIVAGGGGGGFGLAGGGGGGGVINSSTSVTTGNYSVVIGSGGIGAITSNVPGGVGNDSSAFGLIAKGGGGGAGNGGGAATSGGSGGGGSGQTANTTGMSGTSGQGNAGGNGYVSFGGGGGGGAGAVGIDSTASNAGNGGNGFSSSISGTAIYYGGGGGGATNSDLDSGGNGGLGGGGKGGDGGSTVPGNGQTNTGGGGGGRGGSGVGGSGGSGIVIIRYSTGSITATGGTVTTVGGDTIHTFTTSGTFTVTSIN